MPTLSSPGLGFFSAFHWTLLHFQALELFFNGIKVDNKYVPDYTQWDFTPSFDVNVAIADAMFFCEAPLHKSLVGK